MIVRLRNVASLCLMLLCVAAPGGAVAGELTPEQTLKAYLKAMEKGDFEAVYDLVSTNMRAGKDRAAWVKEQQWIVQFAEARILEYQVFPGKIEGKRALVPNLMSSQDKFLNQLGVEEHELYTLVREDGRWKVDQQTIVEPGDRDKWFPAPEKKPAK